VRWAILTLAWLFPVSAQGQVTVHGGVTGPSNWTANNLVCSNDASGDKIKQCAAGDTAPFAAVNVTKQASTGMGRWAADGTNCVASNRAINSGSKVAVILCADAASATFDFVATMPDGWDAGTITFEMVAEDETADPSSVVLDVDVACQCDALDNSYGTPQNVAPSFVTQYVPAFATTAAITPAATCVGGSLLNCRATLDNGTSDSIANAYIIDMKLSITSAVSD